MPGSSDNPASARWVYFFGDRLRPGTDAATLLGGKGAALARMVQAGLPVPPGFTITTAACAWFFAHREEWPPGLEAEIRDHLERLERSTGRAYAAGREPLLVSVRSGAPVSMPGMMDTILNCGLNPALLPPPEVNESAWAAWCDFIQSYARIVAGLPLSIAGDAPPAERAARWLEEFAQKTGTPFPLDPWQQLRDCISAVFRSWKSPRAVAYRERHGLSGKPGTAVNVQAMFPSEVSGVLFTQDPAAPLAERLVLEAAAGLGEAVVSGAVTPDRFLIRRADLSVIECIAGNRSRPAGAAAATRDTESPALCLTPPQARLLGELGLKVERLWGQPMDIEWGWAGGEPALLQCRPIKGLELARETEDLRQAEIARLRELAGPRRRLWVAHNLGETLPNPTPMTWDIIRHFMSGAGGFGRLYRLLGYRPAPGVCREGFLELIGGRLYADPDRLVQMFWPGMPLVCDLEAVAANPNLLDHAPLKFEAEKAGPDFLLRLPGFLAGMWRAARANRRLRAGAVRRFEQQALPEFLSWRRQKLTLDLSSLSPNQLLEELEQRRGKLDEFGPETLLPGFFGARALRDLETLLGQILGPGEGTRLAEGLAVARAGESRLEQNRLLAQVAAGEATLAQFLEQYGHRCPGEMELAEPRWRENPSRLSRLVAKWRAAGGGVHAGVLKALPDSGCQRRESLPGILDQAGASCFREEIERLADEARALLPYREIGKHWLMMAYELIRLAVLEIGRRCGLGQEVFYLRLDELPSALTERTSADAWAEIIAARRRRRQAAAHLAGTPLLDTEQLDNFGLHSAVADSGELKGEPVSPGVAEGPAWILADPEQLAPPEFDYVLVCPSTDPGWTPLFLDARALVIERGGFLSHGAIVARDFGLPAVVCPEATVRLRPGERLRVDGHTGKITRLEKP